MKHQNITVLSVSDPTGTMAPSAGKNGELGRLALESDVQNVNFTSLTDTPSAYAQNAGNLVQVNDSETGLQFINFATGFIICDTVNDQYQVNNPKIKSSSLPILTLVTPDAASASFIPTVYNVIDGQFTIILTDVPSTSGYKVNWLIF